MSEIVVRKIQLLTDRIFHDGGPPASQPVVKGAIVAVVHNPFAGRYEENLMAFMEALSPLAEDLAAELLASLGGDPMAIHGYGKGAIVGVAGELEHAALWHAPGGAGVRAVLGNPKAMVAATKKVGHVGAQIDIPTVHIHAALVRSHYDVVPVAVPDAPRPDEIAYALAMTTGGRVHARIGGLTLDGVVGEDGLR